MGIGAIGEETGLGAVSVGVVGGLLGNQVGGGGGKTVGAVVGAVGGAFAGNAIEKNVRSSTHYEVTVRLDDGNTRVFTQAQPPALQRGDRVRINNGQLLSLIHILSSSEKTSRATEQGYRPM